MINKFWIRWFSILSGCGVYCAVTFYFHVIFSVNFSETISAGGALTASQCTDFALLLLSDHNNMAVFSIIGFLVCIVFVLLVFKKVR